MENVFGSRCRCQVIVLTGMSTDCSDLITKTLSHKTRGSATSSQSCFHGVLCVDEHSGNSCQVALSPLHNHVHNKQIFTSAIPPNCCIFPIHRRVLDNISPDDDLWPLFWTPQWGFEYEYTDFFFFFIDGISCTERCDLWWHPEGLCKGERNKCNCAITV